MRALDKVNRIIVHCSATYPNWMEGRPTEEKVAEIKRWHVENNRWSDIGYHWIIDRDGSTAPGRSMQFQGAHTYGENDDSIGICLLGAATSAADDRFSDHFTPEQRRSLTLLVASMRDKFGRLSIHGHNEYAAKACPGFRVAQELTF